MRLSEFVELVSYPNVQSVVQDHLDMLFNDVRTMLRLPIASENLTGGCNFAVVEFLCNLIGGISRVFYNPRTRPGGDGSEDRFKSLVREYFPWESRQAAVSNSEILYEVFRNPLTHSLGISDEVRTRHVFLNKSVLTEEQIETLELSGSLPSFLPPPIVIDTMRMTIDARSFYWGTFQMFRNLIRDANQASQTEQRFQAGEPVGYP